VDINTYTTSIKQLHRVIAGIIENISREKDYK